MKLRTTIVLVTLVPLVSIGFVFVPSVANERWADMVAWAEKAERQWQERDFERMPFRGDAEPGAAFAAYAEATQQATVLGKSDAALLRKLRLQPATVEAADAEAFALRWRTPLQTMSTGAHRADARPQIDWNHGMGLQSTSLLAGRDLMNAAQIEVRRRIAAGDDRGGVELLLDAMTFAVDKQHSPLVIDQMIASALLTIATAEALRDQELHRLDDAALALLADGLAACEARCVTKFDGRWEALLLARTLLGMEQAANDGTEIDPDHHDEGVRRLEGKRSWRFGWSKRWAWADAVLTLVDANEQLAGADLPWPERRQRIDSVFEELRQNGNPMLETWTANMGEVEHNLRLACTHVRLLRLAALFHRGQDLPALGDPLGTGDLEVLRRDGGATFRSAGGSDRQPILRIVTAR